MDSLAYIFYQIPIPVICAVFVILIAIVIVYEIQCAKLEGLDKLREKAYELILDAEHMYTESGQGYYKLLYVWHKLKEQLPGWMRLFMTDDMLMDLIDEWFRAVKDLLDDGKINNSSKNRPEE